MSDSTRFFPLALLADFLLLVLLIASLLLRPNSLFPAAPLAVVLYLAVMATLLYPHLHRETTAAPRRTKNVSQRPEGGMGVASHDSQSKTAACL